MAKHDTFGFPCGPTGKKDSCCIPSVALDSLDLTPDWTLPDTVGPAVDYADGLLVPVPAGLAVVTPDTGRTVRTLPVTRADPRAAVVPAVQGDMLLEQRGSDLVALRPSP